MKWQDFLPQAQAIVEATKLRYPGAENCTMGGGGGSDSSFSRKGTGYHYRSYEIPANINNLITQNASSAGIPSELVPLQSAAFARQLSGTAEDQPGYEQLSSVAELDPSNYPGKEGLETVAQVDPYSGEYEQATYDAFIQRAADALASVNSGPAAVRGGDARGGLASGVMASRLAQDRGQEVRQAQQMDVQNLLQSSIGSAQAEASRYGIVRDAALGLEQLGMGVGARQLDAAGKLDLNKLNSTQLLQLAASLQGTTTDKQVDDFAGKGDQSGWQAGLSCCFTFYAVLGNELPWFIEIARRHFWTKDRRNGYNWMSKYLVPVIKRSGLVRKLVHAVMVRPAIRFTAWFYGEPMAGKGWLWWPICRVWLAVWSVIGKVVKYG